PQGLSSFWGLLHGQFLDVRSLVRVTEWFRPREFWPPVLPPDYLATATRPMGLLLLCVGIGTYRAQHVSNLRPLSACIGTARRNPRRGRPGPVGWARGV